MFLAKALGRVATASVKPACGALAEPERPERLWLYHPFPATGIATMRQLAQALEMSAESFAEVWNDLPIEDTRIAELLGLTRQQVINARKSGRERLARRLKGFI